MKKQNVVLLAIALITLSVVSCNQSGHVKKVSLKTQDDSLNYYLGYLNGNGIKDQYFSTDSSEKAMSNFVTKLDKAFSNKDVMEKMGIQFGEYLKQMEKTGLMGDSTIKLNTDLIKQGLINGMKDYKEGMTPEQAGQYFQATMQKIQQQKMMHQTPPPSAPQNVPAPKEDNSKK